MVIRTVSEERCQDCSVVTNAYDAMMGRLCPKCIAVRCAKFGKGLEMQKKGLVTWEFNPQADMNYLASANKDLLTAPLIDHSNDIDKHVVKKMEEQFVCKKCGETIKDTDYDWKDRYLYYILKEQGQCEACARGLTKEKAEAERKKVKTCRDCGRKFVCDEEWIDEAKAKTIHWASLCKERSTCACDACVGRVESGSCHTKYVDGTKSTRVSEFVKSKPKISIEEIEKLERELLR